MSSEMREVEVLLNKWLVRYNELIQMDHTNEAEQVLRCINEGKRALLARTEAASVADAELPGMWSTSDFTGGDPDERSYSERAAVGEVIVYDSYRGAILYGAEHCTLASGTKLYTHPQDASADPAGSGEVEDWMVELFDEVYEREWNRAADEADDRHKAIIGPADRHATREAIAALLRKLQQGAE